MFENESDASASHGPEGGGDAEARKKRRRRRGKRKPGATEPQKGSTQAPPPQAAAPAQQPKQDRSAGGEGDGGGRRSRRGNRRRPDRQEETQPSADASAPKPVAPATGAKPTGRPGRRDRQERKDEDRGGSVLQRRLSREAKVREEQEQDEMMPPPPPVNINSVDAYMNHLRGWQREVVGKLRSIVRAQAPDAEETILWSQPVYTLDGPVIYIKAFSDHVNLGFWRGNEVDDPSGKLSGELPTMRHFTIRHVNDVDRELIEGLVRSAVKLNREKGNPTI